MDEFTPLLHGFGVRGVPPFVGDEPAFAGPLAQVNLFMGRNNHGKSSVLRQSERWGSRIRSRAKDEAPTADCFELLVIKDEDAAVPVLGRWIGSMRRWSRARELLLEEPTIIAHGETGIAFWVEIQPLTRKISKIPSIFASKVGVRLDLPDALRLFTTLVPPRRPWAMVPTFRTLAEADPLFQTLLSWSNPIRAGRTQGDIEVDERRWGALNRFTQVVLEDAAAQVEVPADLNTLNVRLAQAGTYLPLEAIGDGVKQVIVLAARILVHSRTLICLEEPESNLHPGLQRKLISFLQEETDNQYLIATHSAHLADTRGAAVFHVVHDGSRATVSHATNTSALVDVCADLGYRASDVLQSNYVIWVEGPSDRLYWRRWIGLVDASLREGVHFTLMTYGGQLADELAVSELDDEAADGVEDDLICLLRLGQHCAVIADSDRESESAPVRATVARLTEEAERHPRRAVVISPDWVRTVENLLPPELLRDVVTTRHPLAAKGWTGPAGPFEPPFGGLRVRKVEVARAVVDRLTGEDIPERLRPILEDLVERIKTANGAAAVLARREQ